ncbi:hypothetical protein B0T26DRAFT_708821 [Lasiosphaeria miniovina]|uniref:Secreted peptide n=1 Tax=Lasiosphaeria miniovina TaxID=1954250 RepID=A0AA40DXE3_9PEZI|nr:uncharacterized protein B0T26DRAFT_708821 [Lasiosphaeria miniovina]KAK0717172.1 hypothetical protein B0T26DRAFT_708821 [Lasiosphaeria miniovina]
MYIVQYVALAFLLVLPCIASVVHVYLQRPAYLPCLIPMYNVPRLHTSFFLSFSCSFSSCRECRLAGASGNTWQQKRSI